MDDKLIALVSAGTSVVAAFVSGFLSIRAIRAQDLANRVQAAGVRNQYFVELRRWADEACTSLSEADHLCDFDPSKTKEPSFFERHHGLRVQLSSLIDRGRWFFPNKFVDGVGTHKQAAFQGYRHEVLDSLVAGYQLVCRLDHQHQATNHQIKGRLEEIRKTFVSQVQESLDPRGRVEEFDRIMGTPGKDR